MLCLAEDSFDSKVKKIKLSSSTCIMFIYMGFRSFIEASFPELHWKASHVPCEIPHTYENYPIPTSSRHDYEKLVNCIQMNQQTIINEMKCVMC